MAPRRRLSLTQQAQRKIAKQKGRRACTAIRRGADPALALESAERAADVAARYTRIAVHYARLSLGPALALALAL